KDGAPSHRYTANKLVFDFFKVDRLLWPSNSLDLSMIEPCQFYIKRTTSKHRDFESRLRLRQIWIDCWHDLEQWRIQKWIRRIVRYVEVVIELKGGNNYVEGS
ncbi:hypothetical protein K431DRAFT_237029, partial [Polychaeton citri CBS 116435]